MEKSDRSKLGKRVASAKSIATDMIPSRTAKPFSTCFLKMHLQQNSVKKYHLFRSLGPMPLAKIGNHKRKENVELSLHDQTMQY